jgi:DNA-binding NtrC family response regulator
MTIAMSKHHSRTAIVVDDDPIVLEVLRGMLEHFEWLVMTASGAEDALESNSLPAPALLVTDVDLGAGMDGFAFCVVARHRWPDIGVVVISGRPPLPKQLKALGSQEFFPKPVTMSALEAAIAHVCNLPGETNACDCSGKKAAHR